MPEMTPQAPGQQGQQPQQPPFGSNPAAGSTPNSGYRAAGLQKLGVLIDGLATLIPMLGATSDEGKDVIDAVRKLGKHIQPGATSPAQQKSTLEQMLMKSQQNGQVGQQLQAQRAQQAQGGQAA
jgi:hypothetical protein